MHAAAAFAALLGFLPLTAPPGTGASAGSTDVPATGNPAECVEGSNGGADLFPDKFDVQHSANLDITYAGTYKVVTVAMTGPDSGSHTYVLVQCGTEPPSLEGDLAGATVMEIPVNTIFSESTSHNGFIDVLGLSDRVTGVANGDPTWVRTASLRARIDAGQIVSFNTTHQVDTELVIASSPDVYITGGYDDASHEAIADAGIPVVADVEWLETSAQGWAEWVGLFAALTNTEAAANALYADWVADYEDAAALTEEVAARPSVITGDLFDGTWYAHGGQGIVAHLIEDAGGEYLYADDAGTGSLQLDIETVLADGAGADVWLHPTSLTSEEQAVGIDSRYGDFAAWEAGGVWSTTLPIDPAVSFSEHGPVMIDEYLLDYIKVLHPDLAPDHELVFLSRLPAQP